MALKHIKLKIQSVKKTSTVTRAMEAVSAVKMRKAQERALGGRAYAAAALTILERLSNSQEVKVHPLTQTRPGTTCLIVITSDKGLAGALNSNVIRAVERELLERGLERENVRIIALGRRGGDYFANRDYDVRVKHENVSDGISESEMTTVTDTVVEWHAKGEISSCLVAYMNFLSTFEQKAAVRQILPITPSAIGEIVKGIVPAKGKYAGMSRNDAKAPAYYTLEPDPQAIVEFLMPRLLNIAIYHGLLEAKASEHSARMVAMKSATDKAK
ncbi:MAG: ATP synthase F1 subunit gamma, partial [Minisyncoccia bacterium]